MPPCKTPGAVYTISVSDEEIKVAVTTNGRLTSIDLDSAMLLERALHDAVESVLIAFWKE